MIMDNEFLKWLAGLGVGGAIAGLIFFFYRKDVRSYTELWQQATTVQQTVMRDFQIAMKESQMAYALVIEKSTAAHVANTETNREIITLLHALHRRLDLEGAPPASSVAKSDHPIT